MKFIAMRSGQYRSDQSFLVELNEQEAYRLIPEEVKNSIQSDADRSKDQAAVPLGTEISLAPVFNKMDDNARKAQALATMVVSMKTASEFFQPKEVK